VPIKSASHQAHRSLGPSGVISTVPRARSGSAPEAALGLDEIERVARIGSYSLDIASGLWVSSRGLDAILGIGATFERSIEGWVSLIAPANRAAMVAYLTDEVLGAGNAFDRQYRVIRADTGEQRWVHGRGALELDGSGRPVRMLGTIADITEVQRAMAQVNESESKYAAIFNGAIEAILIATLATQRVRWVNPAACALLGYAREELVALSMCDLLPSEGMTTGLQGFSDLDTGPSRVTSYSLRRKDGTAVLVDIKVSTAVIDGEPSAVAFLADATERHRLERHDHMLAQAIEQASEAILITDLTPAIVYANPAFERISGLERADIVGGHPSVLGGAQTPGVMEAMWRTVSAGGSWNGDLVHQRADGTRRVAETTISPLTDAEGSMSAYLAVERDVTTERATTAERERLFTAFNQTSDAVIVADLTGRIEYVNPAFERISGYRRADVIGQNPRIVNSGGQSADFYRALWGRLTRGETWFGTMTNRRADGALYEVEASISPIRGPGGDVTGYVGVQRDVTALNRARLDLTAEYQERAAVSAALNRLQPGPTLETTATAICEELLSLPGIDTAAVINFLGPDRAVPLAVLGADGMPLAAGRPLPALRAAYLYERAANGAWADVLQERSDYTFREELTRVGLLAAAYAPIRNGEGLLGVVTVATRDPAFVRHLVDRLPVVSEFAATASALLSAQIEAGHHEVRAREHIGQVLAEHGFRPVFQPIVDLASGEPVGFEALTRFTDGTPPDRMIAEAHQAGLGLELELACLSAALDASETLPAGAWLSLNAAPVVILQANDLAALLADRPRRLILEVTEHARIDDYAVLRQAVAGFGVDLAVDDAGSGFASMRHIVELAPRYLKLDVSLVRHVDRDLTRQAMAAGLCHFASRIGSEVIAEGIEDAAELATLRTLGVPLGQGYLLGRPESPPAMPQATHQLGAKDPRPARSA